MAIEFITRCNDLKSHLEGFLTPDGFLYLISLFIILSCSIVLKQLFRWFPGTDFYGTEASQSPNQMGEKYTGVAVGSGLLQPSTDAMPTLSLGLPSDSSASAATTHSTSTSTSSSLAATSRTSPLYYSDPFWDDTTSMRRHRRHNSIPISSQLAQSAAQTLPSTLERRTAILAHP